MTYSPPPQSGGPELQPGAPGGPGRTRNWVERRRNRIAGEVARNRRGEYRVPTWVMALALLVIVGGWIALIVLS